MVSNSQLLNTRTSSPDRNADPTTRVAPTVPWPPVTARPGEFRPVRVAVTDAPNKDKRIAVTRSGYTGKNAPPQQQTPRTPAAQSNKSQAAPPGRRQ